MSFTWGWALSTPPCHFSGHIAQIVYSSLTKLSDIIHLPIPLDLCLFGAKSHVKVSGHPHFGNLQQRISHWHRRLDQTLSTDLLPPTGNLIRSTNHSQHSGSRTRRHIFPLVSQVYSTYTSNCYPSNIQFQYKHHTVANQVLFLQPGKG